jgi:hypothetical protein
MAGYPWWSAATSQLVSEVILQMITANWMGTTADFGAQHGYLDTQKFLYYKGPVVADAKLMYPAALFWLCSAFFACLAAFIFLFLRRSFLKSLSDRDSAPGSIAVLGFLLVTIWLATWLWWAGFVRLAGDL